MKISYYDLLGLVEKGEEPKEIELNLIGGMPIKYVASYDSVSDDFTNYQIKHRNNETEDYKFYLGDCFLESSMFDKCIEIVEEKHKNNKIEKLKTKQFHNKQLKLAKKINEIIDMLEEGCKE